MVKEHTIPEAAELLALPPRTVRRLIEAGQLDATRAGERWRIASDAIERARAIVEAPPRPVEAVATPPAGEPLSEIEGRLEALEERVARLESPASERRQGSMRPALAPLFRPEPTPPASS